ncbi:MAG: pyrroline-5-carboxylate reductase [Firmicutes bacterium]|nr:pyrroline-5-carboxylate reductase [Bacillota bacterium]
MGKKLVFCGGGNIAEGIICSLLKREVCQAGDIIVSELNPDRCKYLKNEYSITAVTDAQEVMVTADMIVIAVLPKIVPVVVETIKNVAAKETIILSIAAGVTIASLEAALGAEKKIVRVMPNTLSQSGNGHSAACLNSNIGAEEKQFVTKILNALGQTMYLPESMFNAFTAYSCSGPMWLYQMADALVDAGVYMGFSRSDAKNIVIKNMMGVAMVLDESGDEPKSRVSEMCSPGGVTIEGYRSLLEEGFSSAVMTSVDKAVKKANSIK